MALRRGRRPHPRFKGHAIRPRLPDGPEGIKEVVVDTRYGPKDPPPVGVQGPRGHEASGSLIPAVVSGSHSLLLLPRVPNVGFRPSLMTTQKAT